MPKELSEFVTNPPKNDKTFLARIFVKHRY